MTAHAPPALRAAAAKFPPTRYQGSKRRLTEWILTQLGGLSYETVLDAFGGTGAVSYAFKQAGKHVTYNDMLAFNHQIGVALIENDRVQLDDEAIESIGFQKAGVAYGDMIARTFQGIYYTDQENEWLDIAVTNIRRIACQYRRSIAWYALFQAAMAKRPYNLFHRANLYMRHADVTRSFGNKSSWDRPFADHFARFARTANDAVIDHHGRCAASCQDAHQVRPGFDLVYIDPPYVNAKGVGVDYRDFYHFLEGLLRYDDWEGMIDRSSKHRRLLRRACPWSNPRTNAAAFEDLFRRFADSILVVSYRSDGTPSVAELVTMLRSVKRSVRVESSAKYQYALSTRRSTEEMLLIATD